MVAGVLAQLDCAHWIASGRIEDLSAPQPQSARGAIWRARRLGAADQDLVAAFRAARFAELPDPDWYVPEVPEFLGWHLSGERGAVYGLFIDDVLAACTILGAPQAGWSCFAADLPELADRPQLTAHIASTMVDPRWRGCGLQSACVELRTLIACGLGRPHLLARVAVGNAPSWRNMLRCGFVIRRLITMHGDKLRYLFHRDLSASPPIFTPDHWEIAVGDYAAQSEAFSQGFVVVAPSRASSSVLSFARLEPIGVE